DELRRGVADDHGAFELRVVAGDVGGGAGDEDVAATDTGGVGETVGEDRVGAGVEHGQHRGAPDHRQGLVGGAEGGDHHAGGFGRGFERDVHLVAAELDLLLHQAVGEVAPCAALDDEPQFGFAFDGAESVDDVAGAVGGDAVGDDLGEERSVVAVDVEV